MHGHIHLCFRELVQVTYGQDIWKKVLTEADLDDDNDFMLFHYYDDNRTFGLVGAIAKIVDIELPVLLQQFGKHFYQYAATRGYDRMMRTLGKDFQSFVQNLDLLHSLLALTYKGMRPPHFRSEKKDGKLYVHIYTIRPAMFPVAIGTLKEVAKQIFNTEIDMIVTERNTGKIFKTIYSEHVITEVIVIGEDRGINNTSEIINDKTLKNIDYNNTESKKYGSISVPERSLNTALPYSIIFNTDMRVRSAGLHLKTLCPELEDSDIKINDIFEIKEPRVEFTYDNIMNCSTSYMYFFLNCKEDKKHRNGTKSECPVLRGHMVPIQDTHEIMFISSPFFESLGDLLSASSFLTNIPQDKITMEIMFMNEQRRADVEMSKKLDESTAIMKKLAVALENEKKKTDTLLYEMLPFKVANQLREGKPVEAEKHEDVTILFSDIVTFTNIAASCEPIQIVAMLNELFRKFDDLSTQHGVYKVETIGDAYMVAAGVPDALEDHAQRVALMGLDMIKETNNVISPVSRTPIQIRVGIHTGPVVSGVVGNRMPRFCLFGDTVNTASRMESHGVPGKIHVSNSTHRALENTGILMTPRGEIDVKGKGLMHTYFVIGADTTKISPPQKVQSRKSVVRYAKNSVCTATLLIKPTDIEKNLTQLDTINTGMEENKTQRGDILTDIKENITQQNHGSTQDAIETDKGNLKNQPFTNKIEMTEDGQKAKSYICIIL